MKSTAQKNCAELQNLYDVAESEFLIAGHIIDAAIVLSALERAPEHREAANNLATGGGSAQGFRLSNDTLPALLRYAQQMVESATCEVDVMREKAIAALEGEAA